MAHYVVGDVQGCAGSLQRLLEVLEFSSERDRLWLVGDLVNRGPDSLQTLRLVRALGDAARCVLGNHDLYCLARFAGLKDKSADDTLDPLLAAPDSSELMDWLRTQPLFHFEHGVGMVHAGLLPQWSVEDALRLSAEVQMALGGSQWRDFLAAMFGNQPDAWSDLLQGWDRLRVIVNAMTRLRFVSPDGRMQLKAKGPPHYAPEGCIPWYQAPARRSRFATLVFGHWSALGYYHGDGVIGLDTGCVWGGQLCAWCVETGAITRIDCPQCAAPSGWD